MNSPLPLLQLRGLAKGYAASPVFGSVDLDVLGRPAALPPLAFSFLLLAVGASLPDLARHDQGL